MNSNEWAGFTDEDIQRMQANPSKSNRTSGCCSDSSCAFDGSNSSKQSRGPMKIRSTKPVSEAEVSGFLGCSNTETKIDKMARQPISEMNHSEHLKCSSDDQFVSNLRNNAEQLPCQINEENGTFLTNTSNCISMRDSHNQPACDADMEQNPNPPSLEVFEQRQKRIEAENARRKALLIKTIMDKKKRTAAEVVKLAIVEEELDHLDSLLSSDVSILRDCIEKASIDFCEAEKRYLRAEKEFIEAKLILYDKMQRKEQLTEHLCTIIEQNESRKADKLLELMTQLEMESGNEICPKDETNPILPNLCMLNDETYHYQVLNSSKVKKENSPTLHQAPPDQNYNVVSTDNEVTEEEVQYESLHDKECDDLLEKSNSLNDVCEKNSE